MMWNLCELEVFLNDYRVEFEQCEFGFLAPHDPQLFIKKPTRILTNMPTLAKLARTCSNNHCHYRCLGSVYVQGKSVQVSRYASA